jgi:hypothetical protein
VQTQYKSSELVSEHNIDSLKKKLTAAGLTHPVSVDNNRVNWKRFDNRYWPCIYLIDKQGNARFRWDGELKWQTQRGDLTMHEKIKQLLKE